MATKRQRCAFVMLAVIAVSVLLITLLSILANLSLRRGLEAADAERSLQQRWGAITLERTLLRKAPKLFELREELAAVQTPGQPPQPFVRSALTLGDVTFDVLLGDEDAKANLNALYHHAGEASAARRVTEMLDPGVSRTLRLRPATEPMAVEARNTTADEDADEGELGPPAAFRSWGEVFDVQSLVGSYGSPAVLPNVTTGMTCWGSGQLNFRRASDQAILAVAGAVIQDGGAQRLLTRYRRSPTATLAVLLQSEVPDRQDRETLSRMMSETSSSFSIWIDASTGGRKSLRRFTVQNRDPAGDVRTSRFVH